MITSRQNSLVKLMRAVRDGREEGLIFIEGVRLCEEAAAQLDLQITDVICTPRLSETKRGVKLLEQLAHRGRVRPTVATEDVFSSIADTRANQGVAILAARPQTGAERLDLNLSTSPLIVVLDGVTNPANAGAILRATEAAGATGAISTVGTCDLFSPKALRGAMGSSLRLQMWTNAAATDVSRWCAAHNIKIFTLDANATDSYTDVDWRIPAALVVGAEGSGFTGRELKGGMLRIPMRPCGRELKRRGRNRDCALRSGAAARFCILVSARFSAPLLSARTIQLE
jgi:TrmH family RNA methyltransferase